VHEVAFWARHFPGLRSLSQREATCQRLALKEDRPDLEVLFEREKEEADALRRMLTNGSYPDMGTGDPDVYKAFGWRFWQLLAEDGGWIGVVLPGALFNVLGSRAFRLTALSNTDMLHVTMLIN